ncbi:MAG: ATP synthase F0 subunit B [Candidatus Nomurabacteria bacterium]
MQEILNILGSVGFNWHVALANFINFLIILFILNKFFFGKIGKVIETRQGVIERGLSQASDAERALAHAEQEKEIIINKAYKDGHDIVVKAESHAIERAEGIFQDAEEEAQIRLGKLAEKELKVEARMAKEWEEKAPSLVAKLYIKTLAQEMNENDNNALITRMSA